MVKPQLGYRREERVPEPESITLILNIPARNKASSARAGEGIMIEAMH